MSKRFPDRGDKMKYLGKNGYDNERAEADKVFKVDQELIVENIDIGSFRSTIKFVGFEGRFNSVMFELVG